MKRTLLRSSTARGETVDLSFRRMPHGPLKGGVPTIAAIHHSSRPATAVTVTTENARTSPCPLAQFDSRAVHALGCTGRLSRRHHSLSPTTALNTAIPMHTGIPTTP